MSTMELRCYLRLLRVRGGIAIFFWACMHTDGRLLLGSSRAVHAHAAVRLPVQLDQHALWDQRAPALAAPPPAALPGCASSLRPPQSMPLAFSLNGQPPHKNNPGLAPSTDFNSVLEPPGHVDLRPSSDALWPSQRRCAQCSPLRPADCSRTVVCGCTKACGTVCAHRCGLSYAISLWYRVADRTEEATPLYVCSLLSAETGSPRTSLFQWSVRVADHSCALSSFSRRNRPCADRQRGQKRRSAHYDRRQVGDPAAESRNRPLVPHRPLPEPLAPQPRAKGACQRE